MTTCSLLISTYNWPQALHLCLQSVLQQSVLPNEIIIADDGSTKETTDLIQFFTTQSPIPVKHIWQPDEGFQLARIRNKGFVAAASEYIIQIDGDLILHKHFIKDHLNFGERGFFMTGSRVLLSPKTTEDLFITNSINFKKHSFDNKNFFNGIHFPLPIIHRLLSRIYKTRGKHKYYVKGCNMAFWKQDILKVNGYNEAFVGWGREDSELAIRLINAGIKKKFLKFGAVGYHLFHKEVSREMEEKNIIIMKEAVEKKVVWTDNGISSID